MNILLEILRQPSRLCGLAPAQWNLLIALSRHSRLLGRLAYICEHQQICDRIPAKARDILEAARTRSAHTSLLARSLTRQITTQLHQHEIPVILLKGAAYLAHPQLPDRNRRLADVDILVPEALLEKTESLLRRQGWQAQPLNAYDRHYYRAWMHEIPPMTHPAFAMELDLHHNLTPPVSRLPVPAQRLWEDAVPSTTTGAMLLAPADMVLHTCLHLFFNEELRGGLRELLDIHDLCSHFSTTAPDFWDRLTQRAEDFHASRILFYGLDTSHRLLGTAIPDPIIRRIERFAPAEPQRHLMRRLFDRALSGEVLTHHHLVGIALLCRAHWQRMPPLLLLRHLAHKAISHKAG